MVQMNMKLAGLKQPELLHTAVVVNVEGRPDAVAAAVTVLHQCKFLAPYF